MQQSAMGSMNRAMNQMQAMLEQLNGNNPGEGEGEGDSNQMRPGGMQPGASFMQRLMEAAGMQQQINNAMQQLGAEGQLSQEQREQLGRIAAQQGRVMKSIEELAREEKEVGGKRKALGDLDRIADDMREVLTDMQSGTITPETRRRMDRILSRLLDASRSMHERDYEKTRESRPGEDVARQSPSELRLKAIEQLQRYRDFLRQSQLGYTKDYEQLIERYMEQLQRTQSK
jgi:O6-methylguanine-DNA--protein-cysteine methyltransferase